MGRLPGTLLYESGPFAVAAGFNSVTINGILVEAPESITWTVDFDGVLAQRPADRLPTRGADVVVLQMQLRQRRILAQRLAHRLGTPVLDIIIIQIQHHERPVLAQRHGDHADDDRRARRVDGEPGEQG